MKKPIILLALLFLTNFPSMYWQLYMKYAWLDTTQHFIGGFIVSMLCWAYFKDYLPNNRFNNFLLIVGSTVLIGVLWEFAEYVANQTLVDPFYRWFQIRAYFQGDIRDTMKDLSLDLSGGAIYFLLFGKKK